MPYSQLLKSLMEKKKYSNKYVSKQCEKLGEPIAESYISKLLKGEDNIVPTEKKNEVLARVLDVDVNYLLTEDEEFISEAQERYGRRGAKDAQELVSQISGLFAGGEVTEETKDEVMQAIQNAYWKAKKENEKYTPKKYRNEE